jgi:uncharacterized protein (TIGR00255 family)
MSVRSMTGFARVRRTIAQGELVVSIKSVNHRGLDLHAHLPADFDAIENDIRGVVKSGVARGHVQITVSLDRTSETSSSLNRNLLAAYLAAFREAAQVAGERDQRPDLNRALAIPGMLGAGESGELDDSLSSAVLAAIRETVASLNVFREHEGEATVREILQRAAAVRDLVNRMEEIRAGAVTAFQRRLRERLAELLSGAAIEPQRLSQEAAVLADRSDIAEELVRLRTHTGQLESLLQAGGEVGKRLDFLLQEMNRESNTVLSKTGGLGDLGLTMTDLALAAKSEIDKIREQSLNLE